LSLCLFAHGLEDTSTAILADDVDEFGQRFAAAPSISRATWITERCTDRCASLRCRGVKIPDPSLAIATVHERAEYHDAGSEVVAHADRLSLSA
jgi:hypothetical protein